MKVVLSIVLGMLVSLNVNAFSGFGEIEYEPVVVHTSTNEIPVQVNICNYNVDSKMVACPLLDVMGSEGWVLKDVKLKLNGTNEDSKLSFDVLSGDYARGSEFDHVTVDNNKCKYYPAEDALICSELNLNDSFGTEQPMWLENTVLKLDEETGKYILINLE